MDVGEMWVRASVWLAVLCYPFGPVGRRFGPRLCRATWTVGCLAFVVHAVSAYHVHYGWSHAVALRETARQTAELTGRAVGAGLYVNFLFGAVWIVDVAWWHVSPAGHRGRKWWIDVGLHAFMLFVLFNGTVVFGSGPVRGLGLVATVAGIAGLVSAHARQRRTP